MNNKMEMSGKVKNCKPYPEGRTSLLTLVNKVDNGLIVPRHVNLCIQSKDVAREKIDLYSVVLFQASSFQQWRLGLDRFLGARMSNDRNSPEYKFPLLVEKSNSKLGPLGDWADMDYLIREGIDPNLYLADGVNPIWSLMGFDPDSVALVESYKPDTPKVVTITTTMADKALEVARDNLVLDEQQTVSI